MNLNHQASTATVWRASDADLSAALERSALAPLTDLGVIAAQGPEAGAFLQAQLTQNSTAALTQIVRNGYCTPKGRLLAVFDHWSEGSTHYLQLPREILAPVLKRLSMYVLRAKVKLLDVSDAWSSFGLVGPGASQVLVQAGLPAPEVGASTQHGALRLTHLPDGTRARERYLLITARTQGDEIAATLASAQMVDSAVWWWSQIDAGLPTVLAATQEKFVPQMINLEVLGGVDFRKGCYPGQEVVARSQYLGKLHRRMHLAHVTGSTVPGADIFTRDQDQPVGCVVLAATAPGGGMDILFECGLDVVDTPLHLGDVSSTLVLRPLPYAITDVTA